MNTSRPVATIASYDELVAAFRARLAELQMSHLGTDVVAGLAAGHVSKLLCGDKRFGLISLGAMLDALGCDLVLVENPAKLTAAQAAAQRLGVEPVKVRHQRLGRPKRTRTETYWAEPAA
jgi:hypothetical protein